MIPSPLPETAYAAIVALDWADRQHAWAMSKSASTRPETGWLINTPEAIDHWAAGLAQAYPGGPVAVVLEQNRGPLAAQLADADGFGSFVVADWRGCGFARACAELFAPGLAGSRA